jgi:hypothetical protein
MGKSSISGGFDGKTYIGTYGNSSTYEWSRKGFFDGQFWGRSWPSCWQKISWEASHAWSHGGRGLARKKVGNGRYHFLANDITIFTSFASENSCGHPYLVGSPQRTAMHSGTYMRYVH